MKKTKCIHKCRFKNTGTQHYTCPPEIEQQCTTCGKIRWKSFTDLTRKKATYREEGARWKDDVELAEIIKLISQAMKKKEKLNEKG